MHTLAFLLPNNIKVTVNIALQYLQNKSPQVSNHFIFSFSRYVWNTSTEIYNRFAFWSTTVNDGVHINHLKSFPYIIYIKWYQQNWPNNWLKLIKQNLNNIIIKFLIWIDYQRMLTWPTNNEKRCTESMTGKYSHIISILALVTSFYTLFNADRKCYARFNLNETNQYF